MKQSRLALVVKELSVDLGSDLLLRQVIFLVLVGPKIW